MSDSRRVLIVEKNPAGHRLYYVRLLVIAALARGDSVILALNECRANDPEVEIHLGGLHSAVSLVLIADFSLPAIAKLSFDQTVDLTVIPDGDHSAFEVARMRKWRGSGRLTLLIMREHAQPTLVPGVQYVKAALKVWVLRKASAALGARIVLLRSATDRRPVEMAGFPIAIDPVTMIASSEDAARIRETWNLDPTKYWFAILGSISARKNVSTVARSLIRLNTASVGLVVAGACEPQVMVDAREFLDALTARGAGVLVINRLLSDIELDAGLGAVDCIVLAHSNEGPSGLFGKATATGTRVLAAGALSLRKDASQVPDMAHWCALDEGEIASAMNTAIGLDRPLARESGDSGAFADVLLR